MAESEQSLRKMSRAELLEVLVEQSEAVGKVFDCRPNSIIRQLNLTETKYRPLAAYGHIGREDLGVSWEKTDKTEALLKALND